MNIINFTKQHKWIVTFIFLLKEFPIVFSVAIGSENYMKPLLENVGFMKKSPDALKKKFPMCDEFLKVEWIDKEKKIGYSRYDLYRDGGKDKEEYFALIHIDDSRPHFDYDLSMYGRPGEIRIEEVFSIIKKGEVFFNWNNLSIEYDNREKRLDFRTVSGTRDVYNFTIADNRINVCIPYPDNQRMWIAEGKQISKVYSKEQTARIVTKIKSYVPSPFPFHMWLPEESNIIDLNFDGIEDYISGKIVYSYGNKYYDMTALWKRDADAEFWQWSFPPKPKKCVLKKWWGGLFITTDGKNYYLNNECNLTDLTEE